MNRIWRPRNEPDAAVARPMCHALFRMLVILFAAWLSVFAVWAETAVSLEVFVREGCPHCAKAEQFVGDLQRQRPDLQVIVRDVTREPQALHRLQSIAAEQGIRAVRVPAFYANGQLIIGYSNAETSGKLIQAVLDRIRPSPPESQGLAGACKPEPNVVCEPGVATPPLNPETVAIPFLGTYFSVQQLGLPLFTLALGLLDGFNPCSMWVLILMISMLAPMRNRLRMLMIAGTFVAVEGIAYFLFMAAWLNLFLLIGLSRISEISIGLIALLAGVINLKDWWGLGGTVSLSIPEAAKPGIYARIRRILQAQNLTGALIGAVVLAIMVQLVELLCTSGFPALYTRILTLRQLNGWAYYGYLLLYNAAYLLDDVIVLAIGVITLSQRRLQEKEGRLLKLLSGFVMLGLGIYLIVGY